MVDKKDLNEFYEKNSDFKDFVDRCVVTYRKDRDTVLSYPVTQEYYNEVKEKTEGRG